MVVFGSSGSGKVCAGGEGEYVTVTKNQMHSLSIAVDLANAAVEELKSKKKY